MRRPGGVQVTALLIALAALNACGDDRAHVLRASGVAVLVAAPAEDGMDAIVTGVVSIVDGCLAIDEDVAIWPAGTKIKDPSGPVIEVPGWGPVEVGDHIDGAGGYLDAVDVQGQQLPPLPSTCEHASLVVYRPE